MYIETVPNRNSPPAVLLRETYRDGGKIKKRTLLNLTAWPAEHVEGLRILLKGGTALPPGEDPFTITRSLPHGHVAAILGAIRDTGLDRILGPEGNRPRDLVLAMIVNRIIAPASKLATARMLDEPTACTSTGKVLGLGPVAASELYEALDWLLVRQPEVEKRLARKHLKGGCLVLYDVSSSYVEGRCCDLARFGYNRDGKKGKMQIVYGLLCAADGCPVAVEVFEGNTGDPKTLAAQIEKLKQRFNLDRVVLVGDRGMITDARIREELEPAGLDWITALRAPAIQALAAENGPLQMSLFDERDMAEISSPDYPGERLIVCRNRELAAERARKRRELLEATEKELARIQAAVDRKRDPLRGKDQIGLAVGAVIGKHKMAKHFDLDHRGRQLHLPPQGGRDRRRSRARRPLRHPHQPAQRGDRGGGRGQRLQKPVPGGAGLPLPEERRSGNPPHPPLAVRSRARACVPLHAEPITSNGTCAGRWRRCCSTTRTRTPRSPPAPAPSPRRRARTGRRPRTPANGPKTASQYTASTR